jgi:hypothetical protein
MNLYNSFVDRFNEYYNNVNLQKRIIKNEENKRLEEQRRRTAQENENRKFIEKEYLRRIEVINRHKKASIIHLEEVRKRDEQRKKQQEELYNEEQARMKREYHKRQEENKKKQSSVLSYSDKSNTFKKNIQDIVNKEINILENDNTSDHTIGCKSFGKIPIECITKSDYKQQSRIFHPDKNNNCAKDAEEKFKYLSNICSSVIEGGKKYRKTKKNRKTKKQRKTKNRKTKNKK